MLSQLYKEKEALDNLNVYNHDDKLTLLAIKQPTMKPGESGYVPPLNLKEGWKCQGCVEDNRDKNGDKVVVNYFTKDLLGYPEEVVKDFYNSMKRYYSKTTSIADILKSIREDWSADPHFISKEEYEKSHPTRQKLFHPIYEKAVKLSNGIKMISKRNYVYLNLTCLPETLLSRYRLSLEQMKNLCDKGILSYTGKATSARGIMEALRYHLYSKWSVKEYEHNILLDGKIGKIILDDLKRHDKGDSNGNHYATTSYLLGGKSSQIWIKSYNVTAKEEKRAGNREADLYKIEITFRGPFFKAKDMKDIRKFIDQPHIQEVLSEWIRAKLKWVLKKLEKETKAKLKREYGVKNEDELLDRIMDKERTLTHIQKRLDKINAEIKNLEHKKVSASKAA
ncbi:hypothetical protein [Desulfocicer niacini]